MHLNSLRCQVSCMPNAMLSINECAKKYVNALYCTSACLIENNHLLHASWCTWGVRVWRINVLILSLVLGTSCCVDVDDISVFLIQLVLVWWVVFTKWNGFWETACFHCLLEWCKVRSWFGKQTICFGISALLRHHALSSLSRWCLLFSCQW